MKKELTLIILFVFSHLFSQTYENFPDNSLDSIYYYSGDSIFWNLEKKYTIIERNNDGYVTNAYNYFWNNSVADWFYKDSIYTSYYEDNTKLKEIIFPWNTNVNNWADTLYYNYNDHDNHTELSMVRYWNYKKNIGNYAGKYILSYLNPNSEITKTIEKDWWKNLNTWVNTKNVEYTYENNNLKSETTQLWRPNTNEWKNKSKYIFDYDNLDRELLKTRYGWSSNKWKGRERDTTIYESTDLTITINKTKQGNKKNWVNNKRKLKYYKNSTLVKLTNQVWKDTIWNIENETVYDYDSLGRINSIIRQDWSSTSKKLVNAFKTEYKYSFNSSDYSIITKSWLSQNWINNYKKEYKFIPNKDFLESFASYKWNIDNKYWKKVFKKINYYSTAALINGIPTFTKKAINIFPNPATNQIQITGDKLKFDDIVEIYSITGNLVLYTKIGSGHLDTKILNKGIYFVKIHGQKSYKTQRLIIEK